MCSSDLFQVGAPLFCSLLVGIRHFDQGSFLPGLADQRKADRKPEDVSGRETDAGVAGDRGWRRAGAEEMVAVDEISRPRGMARRCGKGIQAVFGEDRVQARITRELPALGERVFVGLLSERTFRQTDRKSVV